MKRTITLIAIAMLPAPLFSQPVLNSTMNLSFNDTYLVNIYDNVAAIDPGPPGANQTWDFGTITGGTFIGGDPAICVDPGSTPFADSAAAQAADVAIKNQNGGDDGPYQYIEQSNTGTWLRGVGWYESGNTSLTTYTDKLKSLSYPLTFGDSFEDTYDMMMYNITAGGYMFRDSGSVYVFADAYGTITTPKGTFSNALRLTRTTISSTWMNLGGTWLFTGTTTMMEYFWYVPGIKIPVMLLMMMEGFPDYSVHYLQEYNFITTGVPEKEETGVYVYPNPVRDKLTLESNQRVRQVGIYDLTGKCCLSFSCSGTGLNRVLDLSPLPAGTYVLQAILEEGTTYSKRIIRD